jgi:hypothetical protein
MGKWEFYNENDNIELNEDSEPSFSFYDFRKWLSKEKKEPTMPFSEAVEESSKESLKEMFKKKVKDKVEKNINKKLKERKKK